ncbi:condensation domain-containing protein [Phyllobacterium phragmitis]|uniref:Norspermidine-2,3-dihydroxybenzoate synthase VibH n=1 Tax=Phyllobacterium phragmitis TaxID=2670329 RepID=A0ABQ0H5Y3_9HYPH
MTHIDANGGWMPLTMPQLDFWEEFSFHPDKPVSTVAHCLNIEGDVDGDALTKAISETIRESEVLSVRFRQEAQGGDPLQCFDASRTPVITHIDLRDSADPLAEAKTLMEADIHAKLDLRTDRLSAQSLFRIGEKRYLWYIRAHHIIVDGYGLTLIEQRCGQLYNHFRGRGEAGKPFHSFASFLAEEQAYSTSRRWEADRAFWTQYLDASGDLPVLYRGDEDYGAPGLHHHHELSASFCGKLRETAVAVEIGWPDLLVLFAGLYLYNILPRQPTGDREVLTIWLPFMSRWGSIGAYVPAMLVNILPFQLALDPQETLRAALARNAGILRKQRLHGRYRIEQMAEDKGVAKGSRFFFSPLVNVLPFNAPEFKGCRVTRHILASGPGDGFNLTFRGEDDGRRLTLYVDADPSMTGQDEFNRHKRDLPAFLDHCLSPDAMERPAGALWSRFAQVSR